MPVNRVVFSDSVGGEILCSTGEKLEMVRLNQSKPFVDDAPRQLFFHLLLDKDENSLVGFYR